MDTDPCALLGWSALDGAGADSTLAGVLAGFLIAAAAALFMRYDRADANMIGLFASGVVVLTLSSYLFTVLTGTPHPQRYDPKICGQIWSQWLPCFTMLLIGGSVLLCGLAWALVSYSENLAVKLIERNRPMIRVERARRLFIGLSACLSLGGTTAVACWLIAANVLYLKTTTWNVAYLQLHRWRWLPHAFPVNWYVMFFVFLFGVYVMVRSAYLVIWHTITARQENVDSCIRYVPGGYDQTPAPLSEREDKRTWRVAKEICIPGVIALVALLACYLTREALACFPPNKKNCVELEEFSGQKTAFVVGVVVAAYIVARLAYWGIVHMVRQFIRSRFKGQTTTDKYAHADAMIRLTPSTEKPEDTIRIKYALRQLGVISYHVVFFSVLGTVFAAALTQGPLGNTWRTALSVLFGGLYPALILLGLSYSVAAAPGTGLPEWKTWKGLNLLP